nr:unnamed protein product [Callosobruchus chinensis]
MKRLLHNSYEQYLSLHVLFIDFKQAYDSIDREKLCEALIMLKISMMLARLVGMTLNETMSRSGSECLCIRSAVIQGFGCCANMDHCDAEKRKRNPRETANIFSLFTFIECLCIRSAVIQGFGCCANMDHCDAEKRKRNPRETANIFSLFTFIHTNSCYELSTRKAPTRDMFPKAERKI